MTATAIAARASEWNPRWIFIMLLDEEGNKLWSDSRKMHNSEAQQHKRLKAKGGGNEKRIEDGRLDRLPFG